MWLNFKEEGVGDILVIVGSRTFNGEIVGSLTKQNSVLAAHSVGFSTLYLDSAANQWF